MNKPFPRPLNVVSLFAGIGGFELAFRKINAKTILMCEIEPTAKSVLLHRLKNTPLVNDVCEIESLPSETDILCAGFPCQDLSSVGVKQGMAGTRSSLVTEVFRLLRQKPCEWVIFENVPFMLHLKNGETMKLITQELCRLGYRWAYRMIDSISFVPQHRRRIFIVASLHHDPRNVILSGESKCSYGELDYNQHINPLGFYWTEGRYALGLIDNAVPTLKAGSTIGIPSPPAILFPSGEVSMPDIRDAERLQGFPADWTKPAEFVAKPSVRWRLVGNAVTVNAVSWIAKKLLSPVDYDFSTDAELPQNAMWPKAAWGEGGIRCQSAASCFPASFRRSSLEMFLKYPRKSLSLKATKGFYGRFVSSGLKAPEYFSQKIQDYIQKKEAER